ncbi:after-VIT domain-containing protein [Cylindrospermum stagnale]|uniref:after-VIT domain-containing protein n=1 Tax=Cylindrospermum stagnale TaxID=142864 RepID=UPI003CCBB263
MVSPQVLSQRGKKLSAPPPSPMSAPAPAQLMPASAREIGFLEVDEFGELDCLLSVSENEENSPQFATFEELGEIEFAELLVVESYSYGDRSQVLNLLMSDEIDAELEDFTALSKEESSVPRLQVLSVTGLDQQVMTLLTQYLQLIQLPTGFGGDLVFEFQVIQGRVRQLVLDEQASSVKEETVIESIRRSLLAWLPSQSLTSTVQLTLRIQPS